jgi:hypothetical protein
VVGKRDRICCEQSKKLDAIGPLSLNFFSSILDAMRGEFST